MRRSDDEKEEGAIILLSPSRQLRYPHNNHKKRKPDAQAWRLHNVDISVSDEPGYVGENDGYFVWPEIFSF